MNPSFNPSEVGMVFLGLLQHVSRYQINADERLEDKIVIWSHLPFELNGDYYENEVGVRVYIT